MFVNGTNVDTLPCSCCADLWHVYVANVLRSPTYLLTLSPPFQHGDRYHGSVERFRILTAVLTLLFPLL